MGIALKVYEKDNVATVFEKDVQYGNQVDVRNGKGETECITAYGEIPYGHKLAVTDIKKGEKIIKYGEVIGLATQDIKKGEYVHIHNLESTRGRGDWEEK